MMFINAIKLQLLYKDRDETLVESIKIQGGSSHSARHTKAYDFLQYIFLT